MRTKHPQVILLLIMLLVFSRSTNMNVQAQDDSLHIVLNAITNDTSKLAVLNEIVESSVDIEVWPKYNDEMGVLASSLLNNPNEKVRTIAKEYFGYYTNNKGYFFHSQGRFDEALPYYLNYLKIAREENNKESISIALNNIAVVNDLKGDYERALKYYQESFNLSTEVKDSAGAAQALHNIAHLQQRQGNLQEAIGNYQKSIAILKKTGADQDVASNINNLAQIFYQQKEHDKAKEYYRESLHIYETLNDKAGIAKVFGNLGIVLREQDSVDKALNYLEQSLEIRKSIGDKYGIAYSLRNIGTTLKQHGKLQEALVYLKESLMISKELGDKQGIASSHTSLGDVLAELNRLDEALDNATQGMKLSKELGFPGSIETAAGLIKNIYKKQKKYEEALSFSELEFRMHDSILNDSTRKAILNQQRAYEKEKSEEQIAILNRDNEIKSLAIEKQKLIRNSVLAGAGLLILLGFLIVNRIQLRKKIEKQQAVIEERRRISTDMHDDLGSNLSKISLMSEVMKRNVHNEQEKHELENISFSAKNALEKMSEIVWTLNPKNDKLANLLAYIRKYAVEYFEPTDVVCKINFPSEIADVELSGEQRRNIFLTIKETLHNVVKHSGAAKVNIAFTDESGVHELVIHDNGKGLDTASLGKRKDGTFGNGLESMKQRMEKINGKFEVENNNGTLIRIVISST